MALVNTSAGVYVNETDLTQVVPTTSTSVGANVGEFMRGPINTPVLIQNTQQFINTFGKPDPVNLTWPCVYANLAFLERSSQLYVVRAVNSDASHRYAGLKVNNLAGNISYASQGQAVPSAITLASTDAFYAYAYGPGTYANGVLGISISSDNVYTPPRPISTGLSATVANNVSGTFVDTPNTFPVTFSYKVSVVTADGETDVSSAVTASVPDATSQVTISIPHVDGAISYNVYRNDQSALTTFLKIGSVDATGSAVTLVDIGPAGVGGITVGNAATQFSVVSTPTGVSASAVSGGSLTNATTYYYRVSAIVGDEETPACTAVTGLTANPNLSIQVTIPHVSGAVGYNVYGRTNGTEELIGYVAASTTGASVTFTDDGSVTPAGALPTAQGVWTATGTKYYRATIQNTQEETQPSIVVTKSVTATAQHVIVAVPRQANASAYRIYRGDASGQERLLTSITQTDEEGDGYVTYVDTGADIDTDQPLASDITTDGKTDEFTVSVYSTEVSSSVPVESYVVTLEDSLDGLGVQQEIESKINTQSNYIRVYKNAAYTGLSYFYDSTTPTYFAGGVQGTAPTASDIALAWDNFADKEKITVRLLINGGVTSVTVQQKMDTIAQTRKDCVAILDVPAQYQSENGLAEVNYRRSVLNLNSNRSALYAPDLLINDPYNDKLMYVPPSGHIAAVYANTDFVAQAWFAPAGLNRGQLTVQGVRYKYGQTARDTLAAAQVNYSRNFPGQGIAVWEAYTLQSRVSALSFVNIRRLLDIIEISVSDALNFSVWEPNDDFLRRSLVALIGDFLDGIRVRRGIAEYAVISDSTNNPPSTTQQGILNISVFIVPVYPVQRIQLGVAVVKSGVSFTELIAQGVTL